MTLTPYRETLALRGIRSLLIVATLGRIPITAGTVTLTLHVVLDLKLGYGAAGLVAALFTIGGSLGAPVMGRITDRRGLRPVLLLTTIAEVTFWGTAQAMPYTALLVAALIGGFLTLPVFSVARQSIAALAPESHRLPAFALDSMTTELSFMAGPALGVFVATTAGPRTGMLVVGAGILLSGIAMYLVNPPIRGKDEAPVTAADRVSRRTWLRPRLLGVLGITMAATLVLSGTDVAVVAILRSTGEIAWVGLVLAIWAAYSLAGGFLYGMIRNGLPPVALLLPMAVLTIPVGLAGGHWWLLAILLLPAGALCAPTITATADAVSRLTPASARGEAMGLHNSSLTVGVALGAPLAGTVMDTFSPAWGFTAVGTVGLLMSFVVIPSELRRRRRAKAAAARSQATKAVAARKLAAQTLARHTVTPQAAHAVADPVPPVAAPAQAAPAEAAQILVESALSVAGVDQDPPVTTRSPTVPAPGKTGSRKPVNPGADPTSVATGTEEAPVARLDPASTATGATKPAALPSPRKARASRPTAPPAGAAPVRPAADNDQTSPTSTATPRKPAAASTTSRSGSSRTGGKRISPTTGTTGSRATPAPRRGRPSQPTDPTPTDL